MHWDGARRDTFLNADVTQDRSSCARCDACRTALSRLFRTGITATQLTLYTCRVDRHVLAELALPGEGAAILDMMALPPGHTRCERYRVGAMIGA